MWYRPNFSKYGNWNELLNLPVNTTIFEDDISQEDVIRYYDYYTLGDAYVVKNISNTILGNYSILYFDHADRNYDMTTDAYAYHIGNTDKIPSSDEVREKILKLKAKARAEQTLNNKNLDVWNE